MGVAIGNGWVNPYEQYPEYANFAYENKLISKLHYGILKASFTVCRMLINNGSWVAAMDTCQLSMASILGINPRKPRFNVYDIRRKCDVPPLCYNMSNVDYFIARDDVIDALGVRGRKWVACNMIVHTLLVGDWLTNLGTEISLLLTKGVNVLVYSGDKDFVCNWRGGEAWTHKVNYEQHEQFIHSNYTKWVVDGKAYGEYKTAGKMTFLRVYDAGHMVPMDQPEASLSMLNKFFRRWQLASRVNKGQIEA